MKQVFIIATIACLIESTISTDTVNESLNGLLGGDSSSMSDSKQVMATTDGLFRIFTTATSLTIFFFKYLFGFIFRFLIYVISPFIWIIKFCWHQFVTKPFDLLLYVLHVLYPVLMFCFAAICCGIFIGGCAGFAAEAFSSILISATWGPQPIVKKEQEQEEQEHEEEEQEPSLILPTNFMETEDEDEEEPFHQKQKKKPISSRSSSISSFFSTPTPSKGKEPLKRPFIDQWRDSFSSTTSFNPSTSSSSNVNPVLIRRMKLSSTDKDRPKLKSRTNSWEWDEDDE